MSGFVFKIQANMDPNHRDRIAFARLCSGKLPRGMKASWCAPARPWRCQPAILFRPGTRAGRRGLAGDMSAFPITACCGSAIRCRKARSSSGVPNFAPEILRRVRLADPMKAKKLARARKPGRGRRDSAVPAADGSQWLVGVVGPLQLDVLKSRLVAEYAAGRIRNSGISVGALDLIGREEAQCLRGRQRFRRRQGPRRRPVFLAKNQFISVIPANAPRDRLFQR